MYITSELCTLSLSAMSIPCYYQRPMVSTRQFAQMSGYSADYLRPSRHVRWLDEIHRLRLTHDTYWDLADIVQATRDRYGVVWTLVVESRDYDILSEVAGWASRGVYLECGQSMHDVGAALCDHVDTIVTESPERGPLFPDDPVIWREPLGSSPAFSDVSGDSPARPSGTRRARQRVE